jgi:toxin ParE1/3/4
VNVFVSAQAERDFEAIIDDLTLQSPEAAHQLNNHVTERLKQLSQLPHLGRPRSDIQPGLRGFLVRPYVLFYRIEDEEIVVVRILHGRRDLRRVMNEQ